MPKKLTPEKAKAYIDSEGSTCPYCGSTDISGGSLEVDAGVVTQTMSCDDSCDEKWIDVYSLVGICQADGERIDIEGDLACPFKHYLCNKCAIWDAEEERCSLLSIAINTKRI